MVVKEALKGFLGYTTIHGCGRLGDSKYVIQRLFWCFATLGSIAMTSYQISRLYQQYRAKHLTTSMEVDSGNITFPIFRFCSLNPAPYSAVKTRTKLMAILYATQQHFGLNLSEFDSSGDITDISDEVKNMSSQYIIGDLTDARSLFGQELPSVFLYDVEEDPLIHNITDFLLECRFQGGNCNDRGVTILSTLDTLYGSCFDFIFVNAPVHTAGPEEGLELMIYLNHAEFIPFIAEAIGINTRIYDSESIILEESTDGVKLSAGFDIHIGLSLTVYNRQQGKDNERCDSSQEYPSLLACYEECLTELITSQCICDAGFRDCKAAEIAECKRNFRKSIHSKCPECKQPCNEKIYEQRITMTRWPSRSTAPMIHKMLNDTNRTVTSLSDNVMKVRVYFSTLTIQSFNEEVAYTVEHFVSDIGGQLGLWIGMSVLTLAEIVELIILILIGLWGKRKGQTSPVIPVNVNQQASVASLTKE